MQAEESRGGCLLGATSVLPPLGVGAMADVRHHDRRWADISSDEEAELDMYDRQEMMTRLAIAENGNFTHDRRRVVRSSDVHGLGFLGCWGACICL
eukprot:s445_g20.t1